jgi:hypothetical protein
VRTPAVPAPASRSLPSPARAPEPAAAPRAAAPPASATAQASPRSPEGGAAAAKPDELADKLRQDWKTIRDGFATAGDDLKAAVRDLRRKLWR